MNDISTPSIHVSAVFFVGPTGAGKSTLANTVYDSRFEDEVELLVGSGDDHVTRRNCKKKLKDTDTIIIDTPGLDTNDNALPSIESYKGKKIL